MQQMVHEISAMALLPLSSLRFFELPWPPSAAPPSAGGETAASPARRAWMRSCTSAERNTDPYSDHPWAASDAISTSAATRAQRPRCTAVAEGPLPRCRSLHAERAEDESVYRPLWGNWH